MQTWLENTFVNRVCIKALFGLTMLLCLGASAVVAASRSAVPATGAASVEWPTQWDGAPLQPLALSAVEHRFAQRFPGAISRMTDGSQVLVLRQVNQPTRMLHPATDCYRGLGFAISAERLERDAQQRLWRCFTAGRDGRSLRVCERIADARGMAFTDTSAWYWAAVSGQSQGPWQAVTTARPL